MVVFQGPDFEDVARDSDNGSEDDDDDDDNEEEDTEDESEEMSTPVQQQRSGWYPLGHLKMQDLNMMEKVAKNDVDWKRWTGF